MIRWAITLTYGIGLTWLIAIGLTVVDLLVHNANATTLSIALVNTTGLIIGYIIGFYVTRRAQ